MPETLRSALDDGAERLSSSSQQPRRDAELLLMHVMGCDRVFLLTHPDAKLDTAQKEALDAALRRRAAHEPMQYILGEQEFYGLRMEVTPDVLIPRPETEHLVEALLAHVAHDLPLKIADVGTGSGAIAVALAHLLPLAEITALDLYPQALQIAKRNAEAHSVAGRMRFLQSDLLAAVEGESFDAIVSNPPYIADSEVLEAQVSEWEPHTALFAGQTGLEIYERLIPQAAAALKPGGWLLLEIGHGQQAAIAALLREWSEVSFVPDLQGISRVACARRSA